MSDRPDEPGHLYLPLDGLSHDELRQRLSQTMHAVGALRRLTFALKELVPKAFEEGFKMRLPETEEPWLIDWLHSESRRALEPLLAGMAARHVQQNPDEEPS